MSAGPVTRRRAAALAVLVAAGCLAQAAAARAEAPLLEHFAAGAAFGGSVGLGAGYLFARREGWQGSDDWRTLGYGVGGGALAGGLLGLGVGGIDRARNLDRRWPVLFGAMGLTFDGAVVGTAAGTIAALALHDKEQMLHGAGIGAIAGGGIGLAAALWATLASAPATATAGRGTPPSPRLTLVAAAVTATDGSPAWLPALAARY